MASTDDLDPRLKKALDEGIEWIRKALELESEHGMEATIQAVDRLDGEEAKKLLFVLLTSYAEDSRRLDWLIKNWQAAPLRSEKAPLTHQRGSARVGLQ